VGVCEGRSGAAARRVLLIVSASPSSLRRPADLRGSAGSCNALTAGFHLYEELVKLGFSIPRRGATNPLASLP
jgi:hypothetical protein